MKLFKCQACQQVLHFENTLCEKCRHRLRYLPLAATLSPVEPDGHVWKALAAPGAPFRFCANAQHDEPYRTLLGHFRHEVGHYYWDRLVRDSDRLEPFRALFGDESVDYGQALQRHYEQGAPADWQSHYVTAYATMHPWEDFAETWAHYLHIVDTLETAGAFGLSTRPRVARGDALDTSVDFDPYRAQAMDRLSESWLPLAVALNNLNRSMGQPDLYPFVLSTPVLEKLAFVHALVHPAAASRGCRP